MNKLMILLTIFLFTISGVSNAQEANGSIKGTITDGNAKAIEAASISLLSAKDSASLKMGTSEKNGKFTFNNVGEGRYLLSVTGVGLKTRFTKPVEVTRENLTVDLKSIVMETQVRSLTAVNCSNRNF
jgi:iron complex outermembrane receptor protein